jgi:carbonic anhydrase/acetyltransferase-like protein (isoleucine patch superfamily)
VGAGALVTEDRQFDDGKLILGSPAKTIRDLAPEQAADLKRSAEIYVANGARYAAGLRQVARGI